MADVTAEGQLHQPDLVPSVEHARLLHVERAHWAGQLVIGDLVDGHGHGEGAYNVAVGLRLGVVAADHAAEGGGEEAEHVAGGGRLLTSGLGRLGRLSSRRLHWWLLGSLWWLCPP